MKKIILLLLLLLLTGCGQTVEVPEEPQTVVQPEPEPEPELPEREETVIPEHAYAPSLTLPQASEIYIYNNEAHTVAVSPTGEIILECTDGTLEPLKDVQTGQITGLLIQRQEGFQTTEWGEVMPLRQWCDLYDLNGTFLMEVPLNYVSAYGDYLYGYDQQTMKSKLYSRETRELLYDNVVFFTPLGEHYFVAEEIWGSPGTILTADGQIVTETPREYAVTSMLASRFAVIQQNERCGLLDETGTVVLPCEYEEIRTAWGDRVQVYAEGQYHVLDLTTGETVFRWKHPIDLLLPNTAVVQIDDNYSGSMLVSLDGTPLLDDTFDWIQPASHGEDGEVTLLCGTRYGDHGATYFYFTPDAEVINTLDVPNGYGQMISDTTVLISENIWDEETEISHGSIRLVNILTGQTLYELEGEYVSAHPMYTDAMLGEGLEEGYIIVNKRNAQGWQRQAVVHESGQVVLDDYQELSYVGGGVVQCVRGFTGGLLRLDGQWLYEEPEFASLNDQ